MPSEHLQSVLARGMAGIPFLKLCLALYFHDDEIQIHVALMPMSQVWRRNCRFMICDAENLL